nr:hypothetical protein [Pinibacter aurantiacus]
MTWKNDWPIIGVDNDADGKGEPVVTYKKPNVGKVYPITTPAESDEFNGTTLGLQWQWQANPKATWAFMNTAKGALRLYASQIPDSAKSYWDVPNVLLQKFPAEKFVATTKLTFTINPKIKDERVGLVIMGQSYASIGLRSAKDGLNIVYATCRNAVNGERETEKVLGSLSGKTVYFRVTVNEKAKCEFSYSLDGEKFISTNETFQAEPGKWIGAKMGLFCTRTVVTNDAGWADVDWFRITE